MKTQSVYSHYEKQQAAKMVAGRLHRMIAERINDTDIEAILKAKEEVNAATSKLNEALGNVCSYVIH